MKLQQIVSLIFFLEISFVSAFEGRKVFYNLHISHSGGTYMCRVALFNQERVNNRMNCNLLSDTGSNQKNPLYRTCEIREKEVKYYNYSFVASERGLVQGEFCPNKFGYILFMRHPINVVNSAFSWRGVKDLTQLMSFAENTQHLDSFLRSLTQNHHQITTKTLPTIPLLYRADNYFTRFLAFNASACFAPWGQVTEEHYQQALKNIQQLDIVFTEDDLTFHFDEVAEVVEEKLQWNITLLKVFNATTKLKNSHGPHRFEKELEDYLTKLNTYDLRLYEEAHMHRRKNSRTIQQNSQSLNNHSTTSQTQVHPQVHSHAHVDQIHHNANDTNNTTTS